MALQISNSKMVAEAGLLLIIPAAYLIISSLMSGLGYPQLYDGALWLFRKMSLGKQKELVNVLISFGPVAAFFLNIYQVTTFFLEDQKQELSLQVTFKKCYLNWGMILISGTCMLTLFLYLLGENCNCG